MQMLEYKWTRRHNEKLRWLHLYTELPPAQKLQIQTTKEVLPCNSDIISQVGKSVKDRVTLSKIVDSWKESRIFSLHLVATLIKNLVHIKS